MFTTVAERSGANLITRSTLRLLRASCGNLSPALPRDESKRRHQRQYDDSNGRNIGARAVEGQPVDFMTYVIEQNRTPQTQALSKECVPATAAIADIFRKVPGTPMHSITRRRLVDSRPVLIEHIVVDPALAPGLFEHSLDGSLTQILSNHYGLNVVRNRVDMRPCALTTSFAELLGVKAGTPGLLVVRTSYAADGRVVEYDQEYWRHDAIRVHVDLKVNTPVADAE